MHYDLPETVNVPQPAVAFTLTRPGLVKLLLVGEDPGRLFASGEIAVEGDASGFARLVSVLDEPDPGFAIVTP